MFNDTFHALLFRKPNQYSTIGANEWGNASSTYVSDTGCDGQVYSKQAGNVITFPYSGGSSNVGIYISAGKERIEKTDYPRRYILWRYQYNNANC